MAGQSLPRLLLINMLATVAFAQVPDLLVDNQAILNVPGDPNVKLGWTDSYSDGNNCYCSTNLDHDIGSILVDTPFGTMSVQQVCALLAPYAPGRSGRPRYNDIQCGNGPANDAGDEDRCPGRVDQGIEGCKYIGPKWNFDRIRNGTTSVVNTSPVAAPVVPPISSANKLPTVPTVGIVAMPSSPALIRPRPAPTSKPSKLQKMMRR